MSSLWNVLSSIPTDLSYIRTTCAVAYLSPEQGFELSVYLSPLPHQLSAPPAGGASSGGLPAFLFASKSSASSGSPPLPSSDAGEVTRRRIKSWILRSVLALECHQNIPLQTWSAVLTLADAVMRYHAFCAAVSWSSRLQPFELLSMNLLESHVYTKMCVRVFTSPSARLCSEDCPERDVLDRLRAAHSPAAACCSSAASVPALCCLAHSAAGKQIRQWLLYTHTHTVFTFMVCDCVKTTHNVNNVNITQKNGTKGNVKLNNFN